MICLWTFVKLRTTLGINGRSVEIVFYLEISVVPNSHLNSLPKKHPTCVRCHNYTVQDIGFLFLFKLLILLVGKFSLLTTFGVMPALIRLYNFGSIWFVLKLLNTLDVTREHSGHSSSFKLLFIDFHVSYCPHAGHSNVYFGIIHQSLE